MSNALYREASGVPFAQTIVPVRALANAGWYSDPLYLERRGIPTTFMTSSPVAIIANRWSTVNENMQALEDRGHMLVFDPTRSNPPSSRTMVP